MKEIFIAIVVGIMTNVLVGLFLLYKGENILSFIKKYPHKKRKKLYANGFIKAIHGYPYRYAHTIVLSTIFSLISFITIAYIFTTYAYFKICYWNPNMCVSDIKNELARTIHQYDTDWYFPWVLLAITIFLMISVVKFTVNVVSSELLVPILYRDILRVRECVAKCATGCELIEYTDREEIVSNADDLIELFLYAKKIIGEQKFILLDGMIDVLTDVPKERNK